MTRLGGVFLTGVLWIGGFGCHRHTTTEAEARRLVDELFAAWNLHEAEWIDSIFVDEGVYEDVAAGRLHRGKDEIRQLLREAFAWAPDYRVTMRSLLIVGDSAATEWEVEGTQLGPVGEIPATGRAFRLRGSSRIAFRSGRIARVTDYYDMATFVTQLGGTVNPPGN